MKNDWILDVLSDLKNFAQKNGHALLAEHLDVAKVIARAEIASVNERAALAVHGDEATGGADPRGFGTSYSA